MHGLLGTSTRRRFTGALLSALALPRCMSSRPTASEVPERFECPPCGCSNDGIEYDQPGVCSACGMFLAPKPELDLGSLPTTLPPGGGIFRMSGRGADLVVHYYRPQTFTPESPILLVIPGSGRNAAAYRNVWLGVARRRGILVAALHYSADAYDFAAYHMGGLIRDLVLPDVSGQSVIRLRDEDIRFEINLQQDELLFHDFDRVFRLLKGATGSQREGYDMFGHSAGGQILHRLALFRPQSKAQRIVAANAGFYTLPDFDRPLPTGLAGTGASAETLRQALAVHLTILLGENDDGDDDGGILLHTPTIDEQGLGRRTRGLSFFETGRAAARRLETPFNWQQQTVPGVGHDFRGMSMAAAAFLY